MLFSPCGNRFQALSGSSGGASASSRFQQGKANEALHPNEVVRQDMETEMPRWLLSCYGHQKGGPNDLKGDASVEEVRWMQHQEKLNGTPDFQLSTNFRGALLAKEKEIKALIKADKKPSVGGMSIHEPNPWLDHITGRSSNPFGSHAGAAARPAHLFGQQSAAPVAGPFGIGGVSPPPAFGLGAAQAAVPPAFRPGAQRAPLSAQFGQTSQVGVGFGAAPAAAAAPFGQVPAAFGQPLAAPPTGMLFGQPAQPPPPPAAAPAAVFGQPAQPSMPGAPRSLFGIPLSSQPAQPSTTALFEQQQQRQQQQLQQASTSTQSGAGSGGADEGDAMAQYLAPSFAKGKIPDIPPPPQLCT
ncbi:hypothetical protein DUNSADRAFT_9076 [Dunaliella salina]|uniref:Uncharacterized protein n=1 Tax=Dunaliella salina TaxID=3046 RepID=A0ABQ7H5I5_DUNSA|nr:hypothetical protein DUNSADRAFT_9076 [Dunaliella salina]|eukprot:KAF5842117.1 hypothetical protein DUNSADRAFT_9076 [Dunaliella salina]